MARRSTVKSSDTGTLLEAMGDRLIIGTVGRPPAPTPPPAAAVPEAKPAPFTAASLLASMAAAAPTKGGKSATPAVSLPELESTIDRWAEAKSQRDRFEAIMADAEAQIIAEGTRARLEACRRAGKVESSVRINGRVTMTQKCQYSAVPMEAAGRLDEAFGHSRAVYFTVATDAKLTDAAVNDAGLLEDIMKAIGPARFAQAFQVKQVFKPSEAFHTDYTLRPEIEARAAELVQDQTIKPYKPSLRV